MVSTIISLLILGILIIVHEAGHFLLARRAGVRVLRFSMGFGPTLFKWTRGHTEYAVSAIPLGGYVKMAGEQREEASHEPWEYLSKPLATRARIIFAGPLVNYLVGLLSLWLVFVIGYPDLLPVVGKVVEGMPAQAAGLEPGDHVESIGNRRIESWEEMTKLIYASPDKPLAFVITHGGERRSLTMTPKPKASTDLFGRPKTIGLIGISPSGAFHAVRTNPVAAIGRTLRKQGEWASQTLLSLWFMLTGTLSVRDSVTGPIGLIYLTSEAVRMGIVPLLFLVSLLSLSLAIFNLLPLPILDGGHLLFLILEKLRGKPVSMSIQERSAQVSFVLLMAFALVICINDVSRFGLLEKLGEWLRR